MEVKKTCTNSREAVYFSLAPYNQVSIVWREVWNLSLLRKCLKLERCLNFIQSRNQTSGKELSFPAAPDLSFQNFLSSACI